MKKLCVLCEDSKAKAFRNNGKFDLGIDIVKNPMSQSSFEPVTHWFSFLIVNDEGMSKVIAIKDRLGYGIVEESTEKDFLKKYNLRYIENYVEKKTE